MATCVFTCSSWFSMSNTICFNMRSGSSAFSTRSFKFARSNVLTLSSNDISSSFSLQLRISWCVYGYVAAHWLFVCRGWCRLGRLLQGCQVLHHFRGQCLGALLCAPHHQRHILLRDLRLGIQQVLPGR